MDASAFFSSGPSPPQQQQQGQGHAPQQSDQFYGGSSGGTIGRANSMESDSEFETLDINEPLTTHHHHGAATATAATNSGNNNHNNSNGAANFFGGQQHPPPQQYGNQYQASSGPENFSMASSGPENFSMPSSSAGNVSDYTNSNHQNYSSNNSNYSGNNNNYNNDHTSNHSNYSSNHSNNYNNQEPPMEYEGVALQTALNTFTAVGRLGGGLASNVIGGGSRLIGGGVTSGVGSVVGGAKNVVGGAKSAVGGASGMGNSVTSGMGSMMKGIGNFASGLVGVGEEDDEIAAAMAQWAEGQKRLQQQQQQQGNGSVGQGQGNVGQGQQQQQQQQHVQEGYLHQEHRHQQQPQQQYAQPQPQQGYNQTSTTNNNSTAQQVFNAPSPLSTPQFGATRNTTMATVGPPAMSLGAPATAAIVPLPSHHVQNSIMDDDSQGVYPQQQPPMQQQQYPTEQQYPTMESVTATTTAAPPGQYAAVSSNMVSSEMRMSSNASAVDVFGGSTSSVAAPVSRMSSNASAADVFGSTTTAAPVSRMTSDASAADVVGSSSSVAAPVSRMTSNPSAADVFGSTTTTAAAASEIASASGSSGNASAENVFGSTTTTAAAASENVNSSTENVVGGTTAAADVFGGATTTTTATENASAADVFGGTSAAPENASATDVFGGANTAASGNASSAENVFGAISANVNPAKDQVFGATNMAATVNASAADVFGTSASKAASASEVFAAVEATTPAADVFGGTTYPPTSAEEVLGGNEVTEIPTVVESIEAPPLPEGWAKGIDEASGNPYYYNSVTGESSWVLPEDKSNAAASTEQGNVAVVESAVVDVDALINAEEIKEQPLQQHPEIVHRQSSNQLSSLECAEHDPNFQYSDPLVGSAVAPATNAVAKPPVTGNVLAMEIGNYHPPTAMVTMMEQQQDVNVSAPVDVPSVSEHVVAPVAVKEEMKKVVDAAPETETAVKMFEGTSIQHGTPPLVASSNTSTIASSPAESTEKHTITSSLAPPEKRPTVATSNTHRRFQLNLPKKASLPLPPPRNKKASSSVSGGGSLGSTSRKKKLSSSPFRKPPPMEVSATPRFHVPPPAGGSSVGSGGSGSHLHYPLPKAATPGSTSVLTTSPLPTPRVLDDGEDDNVPSSASPLLPAASTSAVVEPKVVETTESEPDVPKNASPDVPAASDDGDRVSTEEPKVAEASIGTESTPPVVFQPLELDQIVEAVATPSEEFKMELPKKEANYSAGEDIVNNVASTMTQGVMHDAVLHVASTAINSEVPPPTYSLTTRPIYHKDELPKAESSLFTEDGASDYQSTLRDEDLPPISMSNNNEEENEVLLSVESEVAPTQVESEKLDAAPDTPKEDEVKEFLGEAMASSSVVTEYPISDYQEQVTDEDFVIVDSSDVDNNVTRSNDAVPVSSSPWVETVDPASGQTYYYNQENGETSWQLPIEAAANEETVASTVVEPSPEVSPMADHVVEESVPADDANESPGVFEEPASMADDAIESPRILEDKVVVEPEITEEEAPLLPDGWVKGIDEASGNPYYYNSVTGESLWDLPSASTEQGNVAVESAPVDVSAGEEINDTDNVDEYPKVEVEHEEVAQVNADEAARFDSPTDGQVEGESGVVSEVGPLPTGWMEANDPSGRVFYFNSSTGQSSWERPKSVIPDNATEDLTPVVQPTACDEVEVVDTSVKIEDDAQVQIENLVLAEESVAPLEDDEDNLSFESLPPGWIETKDSASGQIYFYNEKTEESCWSRPVAMPDPAVNVASEVESDVKDESDIAMPETVEEPVPSEASINDEANIALADQEPVEEPRVNSEAVHEGSTYDSLSRPIMEIVDGQDEIAFPVDSALVPEESPQVGEDEIPEENDADLYLQESHANEFVEESTTAEEIVPLPEEELPAGWLSSIDETTSKIFYYNEETGESTWDKPSIKEAHDATKTVEVENSANSQQQIDGVIEEPTLVEETARPSSDESEKLPPGWSSSVDEASGNVFYYNDEGITSWDKPSIEGSRDEAEPEDETSVDKITEHQEVEDLTDGSGEPEEGKTDVGLGVSVDEGSVEDAIEVVNTSEMKNNSIIHDEVVEEHAHVEVTEAVPPSLDITSCDDELPPGWFASVDESSGKQFYYNEDGRSSWETPMVDVGDAASIDEGSIEQMDANKAEVAELDGDVCETNVMDRQGPEAVEPSTAEEIVPSSEELPSGWLASIDETTGKMFYYNEETGESTWDKPSIKEAPDASPEDEVPADDVVADDCVDDDAAVTETVEVEHDANLEQVQVDEQVAVVEAIEEPPTAEDIVPSSEELLAGWSSSIDEATGKTFYYNEETGESSWDKPSIKEAPDASPEDEVPADDIGAAESEEVENNANNQQQVDGVFEEPALMADDANESPSPEVSPMTDHVVEESVPADDANEDKVVVESEITEDEAPLLPDGWVKGIDEASGNPYYYNSVTGESSWDLPSDDASKAVASTEQGNVAVESAAVDVDNLSNGEDDVPADDIAAAESEEMENNANSQQQNDGVLEEPTPVEETARPSLDESEKLPPGWSSSVDEASGNIFYYNDEGITSWDKPSIEGSRDEAELEDETSVDKITEHQEEVEDLTDGSGEPEGGETDVDLMTKEMPQTGGLPHGWKELQDEATGNTYYWNEQTNETSWDYPHATADEDADAADVLTETEEKGVSEEVAEDEHISEQVDEHISEQVASDQDGGDRAAEPQPNENCYDIPEGWVATVDETSGNTYYYNEKTNETSWDRPVAEIKPELPSFATPKLAQRCRPAHAIATFGFGGRLCVMMPQVAASLSSTVSQPSSSDHPTMRRGPVVIHRVKDLIPRGHKFSIPSSSDSDTVGPLVKAKEKDVVSFLRQRSASPENLIWNLINIAAQNKGRLKNGDDVVDGGPEEAIVDLLLSAETGKKSSHSNAPSVQSTNSDLNDVQDLLLRGDRDRAVVEALREKNYALALIIATMCDEDTYQMVARKFADDVLSAGSPLYTTALLLTDNLPLPPGHVLRDNPRHGLSFWCEDPYQDLDTNWTQQLATILSNKRGNYTKIIMTLGDRLMQLGHCHAAHVCYLATSLSLNNPSKPSTRMVLLGCDHTVPLNRVLMTPEAVEAFERSEAFEWARRLGNKRTSFSALQPFKLRYAELLADVGHEVLAREYLLSIRICTGIGIITRSKGNPASSYDSGFVRSLRELDDRICGSTGAERSSWNANEESSKGSLFSLGRLSALVRGKESNEEEVLTPRPESEVDPLLELDTTAPPATQSRKEEVVPPAVTKPKEEPTKPPEETGALNTSIGISNDAKQASTIDDAPASAPPSLAIGESMIDRAEDSKRNEEKLSEKLSTPSEPIKKDAKKKAPASEPPASAGLLARLFGRDKNVKVADQGEEMQAYYDDKLKRWIFPGDDPAEVAKPLAPPPIMKSSDKAPSTPAPAPAASNDPLAALMAPPSRATSARKGLPPTMSRYADPLASMGNMSMSTPGATMKRDAAHAAPTPKFAVFQPIPTKPDPSKDEKENVAAS